MGNDADEEEDKAQMKTQRIVRLISKKETNKQLKTFLCVPSSFEDRQMSHDDDDDDDRRHFLVRVRNKFCYVRHDCISKADR